ncbi:MAG: hypothetical protein ABFR82_14005 [Nitrospirota bacterium]
MRNLFFILLVLTLCIAAGTYAQSACDGLAGASYGLCNAYCEAMDCSSDNPQASEAACDKIYDKFVQIQGEMPPCEMVTICHNPYEDPHDPAFPVGGITMTLTPEEADWHLTNHIDVPCACDDATGHNSTIECGAGGVGGHG